jgi:hypothetical protein
MMRALFLALCLAGCVQALPQGAERPPRESDLVVIDAVQQSPSMPPVKAFQQEVVRAAWMHYGS